MRRVFLALALVAMAFNALVPPGYMVGQARPGGGASVVICTGHGSLTVASPFAPKAPPAKGKADTTCAFAGHAAPTTTTLMTGVDAPYVTVTATTDRRIPESRPGLGLAAPPPPSHGPPALLV